MRAPKNIRQFGQAYVIRCTYPGRRVETTVVEMGRGGGYGTAREDGEMIQAQQGGFQNGARKIEVFSSTSITVHTLRKDDTYETVKHYL